MSTKPSPERPDSTVSKDLMRPLPLFAGLSEEDLDKLYEMSSTKLLPAGRLLIEEGTPGDELYIVVDGELEVSKLQGGQQSVLATRGPGDVVGEMSLLEQAPRTASVRARQDSRLLVVSQAAFKTLLSCSSTAALTILQTVTSRLRSTESMLMQREKLAALGTMAAGLAHELNNPAAAVGRSTSQLARALAAWESAAVELGMLSLDPPRAEALDAMRAEVEQRAAKRVELDAYRRSEQEDDLQAWLETCGVESAWDAAPMLVSSGWTRNALEERLQPFGAENACAVARWLAAASMSTVLLAEVSRGAEAISEIVKAVKSYAFLDRAPIQEVDVHEGLEHTLVILRHKTKDGIAIVREYAEDLPRIEAYGSELNQVWTNLIDNAIDALQGQGELRLRTYARENNVVVEISDDGPGIPPEVQSRIFDPFFTTKPVGAGTGLGLHIAYNIIVHRHRGQITVHSRPGATCFQVTLPLHLNSQ